MKAINIHFFSPTENEQPKSKVKNSPKATKLPLSGYISTTGKIVLPARTVANLGVDLNKTSFKVGIDEGKRKAKLLYLVPGSTDTETFVFHKAAKSYTLALAFILKRSGVDYAKTNNDFTIRLFEYEGITAFALQITPKSVASKAPYMGKSRGRRPKVDSVTK